MKVLMINKFLYPKAGAETYVLALGRLLTTHGHEVQYFGLGNPKNTVGNRAHALVKDMDFSKGIRKNLNAPFRIIYNAPARRKLRKVLDDFHPDVIHLNNIQYHLTPSIILEAERWRRKNSADCRIVYTAHDYQLICPSHGLFDADVRPCEKCLDGKYIHCVETKCLKNSRAKSLLGTVDGYFWKHNPAYDYVDAFICCSRFLKDKLDTQPRFCGRTIALHNFKDVIPLQDVRKQDYILEFGRLCKEKGTETLLEVARRHPEWQFRFVGFGPTAEHMTGMSNVEYLGFKTGEELHRLIAEASVSVCPSEWYENCPFSVIESIALGTPVVGSRMGGIPELIEEGKSGELFTAGDADELTAALRKIIGTKESAARYAAECLSIRQETSESYYEKLLKIYEKGAALCGD